ncbi:hypothetical protein [Bacillus sp. 03113]|uniref:hypothetical protein n=1 Tax=Bacillus sp. 03113 TaxID=2578211 RepID=UPI0015E8C1BA|nr:hypothetical protein [Bacillus sp. 03113]
MTQWALELRYKPYAGWSDQYISVLKRKVDQSIWRMIYHIQPTIGLLNDPNGELLKER